MQAKWKSEWHLSTSYTVDSTVTTCQGEPGHGMASRVPRDGGATTPSICVNQWTRKFPLSTQSLCPTQTHTHTTHTHTPHTHPPLLPSTDQEAPPQEKEMTCLGFTIQCSKSQVFTESHLSCWDNSTVISTRWGLAEVWIEPAIPVDCHYCCITTNININSITTKRSGTTSSGHTRGSQRQPGREISIHSPSQCCSVWLFPPHLEA